MKRTFTFLLTALFLCVGMTMKAQVTIESPWAGSAIEDGQTYYLYNVKANAFLKGANSWGTQASFGEDAVAFTAEGSGDTYGLKSLTYGDGKYLGDGLYVDQAKKDFVFAQVGDGTYTIAKDGAFLAYDGNSVVKTVAEVTDGCYWQLLTKESILADMAAAAAGNPYAVTALIPGANFCRDNNGANSAWTGGPSLDGDMDNFCAEKWNAGISSVTQTLTGLPNGTYKLQAQGLYRMGGVDAAVALRDAGTEVYDVNFIANDSKVLVMSVMDEAGKLSGVGDNYGTYGAAPNNRNHASKFFNAGYYEHELYFTVTDGTAVIGVANNTGAGADWLVFDNFRLTYYGTATVEEIEQAKLGEFFTEVEDLIAAAEAIEATYSAEAKAELEAAIATGKAAIEALTKEALVAAVAPLQAAIARAERSVALNAIDLTSATLTTPIDMTQFIANPDMETGDIKGWTTTAGWQFQNNNEFTNGDAVINRKFQERWEWNAALGNTSTMQTLLDMPNGVYSVSASIISTRQDAGNPKEAATGVYLFAGDEKVAVATDNNTPELFTVKVEVTNNALTLGIKGEEANANWIAFDNVKLSYLGDGKEPEQPEEPEEPEVDPNDYTSYIINADLSTGDAWNTAGTKGISDGMVKVASESAFDFSQTITLPAGQYKVTAKAAYRYTGSEQEEYDAIQAGTETHLVKLYAETSSHTYEGDVMNRYEGASETNLAGDGVSEVNGKFVPNSSNAVLAWFNAGMYVNELVFNVQEEGAVKIGITRVGGIAGDYANIGAWTLTRLGDAEADPEVVEPEEPETPEEPGDDPEATVDFDVTDKVNKDGWICENGNRNTVTIDGVAMTENYQHDSGTTGIVLWQDVTGLENGKYTVELWANARVAWVASTATDGQEDLTYLIANNVEIPMKVLLNPGLNSNATYVLEDAEVTDGTLHIEMIKKAAGSNWHTIQIKSLTYHATNEVVVNLAKADLQAALDAANAVTPVTDEFAAAIAAAQAVYDNSNSKDEVVAATATLKEATKLAILMNATEENPVLTDFVVNGTFDAGTAGWASTTGATNQGTATNQQGAFTGAFFENWNSSNYDGKLYQVIENVPNGVYELSICAFVETYDASAQFVYANGDKVALTTGAPTAYTVRTIVENNTIEIGFVQTAKVNRWCGIDNVSLTYFGEASNEEVVNAAKAAFTAAYAEFGVALEACQAMMLKTSYYEIDDAAYQLNEQLESTTDVDALNAMVESLNEATASLNEINEVYAEYNVFVQKFKAAAEISEPKTAEAAELLEYNMYGGAGMQATSLEALEQAVQSIKEEYFTYIANANLLDGNMFNLTYLIQNPNFDNNLDGWTPVKANRIGGEGYNGIGGIAEIGEWGATSWDASMSQTLNELPNGKYIVKAAWMAASGIEMTFAANEGATTVIGIGDQGGNIAKDGSVVEMGQGHRGWQYVEVEGTVEDGVLTIAVNSSSSAQFQWSNADAFELYYAGAIEVEPEYLPIVSAMVGDVEIVEGAATVESISTIDITFDRPVALAENAGWATLADSWGPTNLDVEVLEGQNVVRFSVSAEFNGEFTEAGEYALNIPEGFIVGAEEANYINAEITATITIEAAPATPLTVTNVTVGEDAMEGFTAVATPEDMIKVNFDGQFYFQGMPSIVDAEGNDASEFFMFANGLDVDGSNSYIFMGQKGGIYTITLAKASFMEFMSYKAPAEDIVLTVQIVVEPEMLPIVSAMVGDVEIVEGAATVESISTIDITFDRPVALAENAGWATLADSWGPTNLDVEVLEGQNVVRFSVSAEFNGEFTEAGEYALNIPEGFIVGAEEANYINAEITATITIEAAPATPLTVTNVTVGEDAMEGFTAVATPEDMIKVNFDGQFYFQGMPSIVDAEGNDASEYFQFMNGMDLDGSNAYILMAQNWEGTAAPAGIYTITLAKASFMVNQYMPAYKAPAEDIVLTVQITFPDGIENIEAETELVIYDLSGRRVNEMTKGIYIVNGKKVIKK